MISINTDKNMPPTLADLIPYNNPNPTITYANPIIIKNKPNKLPKILIKKGVLYKLSMIGFVSPL